MSYTGTIIRYILTLRRLAEILQGRTLNRYVCTDTINRHRRVAVQYHLMEEVTQCQ